jgi:hypothetical protein
LATIYWYWEIDTKKEEAEGANLCGEVVVKVKVEPEMDENDVCQWGILQGRGELRYYVLYPS